MPEIEQLLQQWQDEVFMEGGGAPLSFSAAAEFSAGIAEELRGQGVASGTLIAVETASTRETILRLLALWRFGAASVHLSPHWPRRYKRERLETVNCGTVLSSESGQGNTVDSFGAPAPHGAAAFLPNGGTLLFTSGSSGAPKAVLHSLDAHLHSAWRSNDNIPLAPGDTWLLSLPLYHVASIGILFRCMLAGASVALPHSLSLAEAIERHGVTHVSLVPAQLRRLLGDAAGAAALRRMKAVLLGGSANPPGLIREAYEAGVPLVTSYGMTETASQIAATRPGDPLDALMTSGHPLEEGVVRLETGGEVCVGGASLFSGYLERDALVKPFDQEGFFHTGDLGYLDKEGRLHIAGRADNRFVSGGENIQPEEIERELGQLAGVLAAVVVPAPDAEFVHKAVAVVQAAGPLNAEALREQLRARLPRYKVPRHFLPWPAEWEEGMKVDRRAIQAYAAARAAEMEEGGAG